MQIFLVILIIIGCLIGLIGLFLIIKSIQVKKGREQAENEYRNTKPGKLSPIGELKKLSVLPLIDFYTDDDRLKTEAGVSYLIEADGKKILLDVGLNRGKEHPSPLLHNMNELGISPEEIDMIYFSHLHLDHVGGMKEQKEGTFSVSQGSVSLGDIPVLAPVEIKASDWNPGPVTRVTKDPEVLGKGIATIGAIDRYLFLMGISPEQSLAFNVKGKGIVLVIGCGHQTIERILERSAALFDEPVYAIIGGLHFPVNGGRIMAGPFNIQSIVGSDRVPWKGLSEKDVESAIKAIKKVNPAIVALSEHDSSDWSVKRFREEFGDKYVDVRVGKEIVL